MQEIVPDKFHLNKLLWCGKSEEVKLENVSWSFCDVAFLDKYFSAFCGTSKFKENLKEKMVREGYNSKEKSNENLFEKLFFYLDLSFFLGSCHLFLQNPGYLSLI